VDFDLFFLWRRLLMIAVVAYVGVNTVDRVRGTWHVLHGRERYWGYTRKYLSIQLLRVGWRDVGWELVQIAFWLGVLSVVTAAHRWV
jgi:hypothetical protein